MVGSMTLPWKNILIWFDMAKPDIGLLTDLNSIADFVIGNESPEEVSFSERNTLPEILSYAEIYGDSDKAISAAIKKLEVLETMVKKLKSKLIVMRNKINIKKGRPLQLID